MLNRHTVRLVLAVSLSCGMLLASASAAQEAPGLTFDVRITSGDSAGSQQTGRGWIAGKRTRLDLRGDAVPSPMMPGMESNNVSVIVEDSAGVPDVAMLMHDTKKIMRPSRMMAQLKSVMEAMEEKPKMSFSVKNVAVDTLGAGETVSGFATRRYRIRADIGMSVEMMGQVMSQSIHLVSEGDYAEDLADFADPLAELRGFKAMTTGVPWMDSASTAEMEKLLRVTPRGLALRHVDRISGPPEGGVPSGTTTTVLSNVKREPVPAAVFAVPEGYTEMELPQIPQLN